MIHVIVKIRVKDQQFSKRTRLFLSLSQVSDSFGVFFFSEWGLAARERLSDSFVRTSAFELKQETRPAAFLTGLVQPFNLICLYKCNGNSGHTIGNMLCGVFIVMDNFIFKATSPLLHKYPAC